MNCRVVERKLYRFVDEEMDSQEKERVGRHLSGCLACMKKVASLKVFQSVLREGSVAPPLDSQFDIAFWSRANRLRTDSWIRHSIRKLEWALPIPNMAQLAVMFFLAFIIGGVGALVGDRWTGDSGMGLTAAESVKFLDNSSLSSAYWRMNGDFGEL